MTMSTKSTSSAMRPATREDFQRLLGTLDDPKVIDILELKPTVADIEEAAVCVAGDHDVLAKSGHHVSAVAAKVVEILTADEDEEPPPQQPT
ncbi:hypothetical protein SAMN02745126_05743 [Enhydrobacter aerosaccus]|uniref:Uncharacterized protein n=2 Tax=Enhydrobacter aerosaccus TaxID=225324 RepID=A0A1T4T6E7_9HYPH|nr:hypothetical protein SAMN02745126_05743 [Enhydrobacter aerosaccus]